MQRRSDKNTDVHLPAWPLSENQKQNNKLLTSAGDAAVQAVRVLPIAQAIDEGPQLTHVVHPARHHHLLVDDVGLRQVRSLLQATRGKRNTL